MCIETQTWYSSHEITQIVAEQPGSCQNLTQEHLLQTQKNHLEAKAREARLMSMRNPHTVLMQKQIEQIHSNRMEAIVKHMKKRQVQQIEKTLGSKGQKGQIEEFAQSTDLSNT